MVGAACALPEPAGSPPGIDYSALKYTESRTADAFQEATGTAQAPAVHVRGFPVLTQLAGGTLKRVDISARQIPAGSQSPVPISDLARRSAGQALGQRRFLDRFRVTAVVV
jgi:hypothetical protein